MKNIDDNVFVIVRGLEVDAPILFKITDILDWDSSCVIYELEAIEKNPIWNIGTKYYCTGDLFNKF